MAHATRLIAQNLGLTVVMIFVCLVGGSFVGSLAASIQYPETRWVENQGHVGIPGNRERGASVRSSVEALSVWVGLVVAQSVFLVMHLGPQARVTTRDIPKGEGD